jgi:DNA-binding transcriptional LysR family regulator
MDRPGPTTSRQRAALDRLVTVHQLRLLVTVADEGGISRAADRLHLSQPAVSHQLKALRTAVGIPLLETVGRRTRPTAAGDLLVGHARRILAEFEAAGDSLEELRGLRRGTLRVVGDTTVGTYVLPSVLGAFRKRHPAIEVQLDIGNRQHVLDRLAAHDVDFAVSGRPWTDETIPLVRQPFLANELVAIASPRDRLAAKSHVTLAELAAAPFIIRERGSGTRETSEDLFHRAGLSLRPVMELASNGAIKRAVAEDLGVAVVSRVAATLELELGLIVELPVEGFPIHRQWHLIRVRGKHLAPAAEAFLQFLDGDASHGPPEADPERE